MVLFSMIKLQTFFLFFHFRRSCCWVCSDYWLPLTMWYMEVLYLYHNTLTIHLSMDIIQQFSPKVTTIHTTAHTCCRCTWSMCGHPGNCNPKASSSIELMTDCSHFETSNSTEDLRWCQWKLQMVVKFFNGMINEIL